MAADGLVPGQVIEARRRTGGGGGGRGGGRDVLVGDGTRLGAGTRGLGTRTRRLGLGTSLLGSRLGLGAGTRGLGTRPRGLRLLRLAIRGLRLLHVVLRAHHAADVVAGRRLGHDADLLVLVVELLREGAVHVHPPLAAEALLLEDGALGAEEAHLHHLAARHGVADVEGLAAVVDVSVVARDLALAGEAGGGDGIVDGVVITGLAGHRVPQPLQRVTGAAVVVLLLLRQLGDRSSGCVAGAERVDWLLIVVAVVFRRLVPVPVLGSGQRRQRCGRSHQVNRVGSSIKSSGCRH